MKNIINKIGKGLLTLSIPFIIGGCSKDLDGEIIKDSFYEATGGWGGSGDRYTALIRTSERDTIIIELLNEDARKANLIYSKGEKVKIEKMNWSFLGKEYYLRGKN